MAAVWLEHLHGIRVLLRHLGGKARRNIEFTFGQRQAGAIIFASSFWDLSGRGMLSSGQSLFATPWTAAWQASLSITNSQSLLNLMCIESVMPSNHVMNAACRKFSK